MSAGPPPWRTLKDALSGASLAWLGLAATAVLVGAGAAAFGPLALKYLVDAAIAGSSAAPWVGVYVLAVLIQRACEQGQAYAFSRGELVLTRRFAVAAFEHLLRLPLPVHLQHRSGALAQSITEGVGGLRLIATHSVLTLLPALVQLALVAAVMRSQLGGALTVVLVGALLAYGVVFAIAVRRLAGPALAMSSAALEVGARLSDGLMNVESLKAFTAETRQAEAYAAALQAGETHWRAFLRRRLEGGGAAALVFVTTVWFSLQLALGQVAEGKLSPGDLAMLLAYLLQVVRPVEALGFAARDIGQGRAALAALAALLRLPPEPSATGSAPTNEGGLELVFEDVHLAFESGRPALQGVSFRLAPCETLALVGPSGAGKSSIVRLVLGFFAPDSGVVRIDGAPISTLDLTALRRQIALVGQDTILLNESLAANIALGAEDAAPAALERALATSRLSDLLAVHPDGLQAQVGERGLMLSGGERQRVAIARALVRRARLLVLDEATAALDPATEAAFWRDLQLAGSSASRLVVTHRLAVAEHADMILMLDRGRVVESGRHDDLIARRGAYWELWRRQGP